MRSSPSWRIRPARGSDLEGLVALWKAYIREVRRQTRFYGPPDAQAVAHWKKEIRPALAGRKARGFVAEERGRLVAMLFVEPITHDPHLRPRRAGYVHSAYVRPGHRRRGILRALAAEAERWSASKGLRSMAAWVLLDNREALEAWRDFGYVTSAEYLIKNRVAKA